MHIRVVNNRKAELFYAKVVENYEMTKMYISITSN